MDNLLVLRVPELTVAWKITTDPDDNPTLLVREDTPLMPLLALIRGLAVHGLRISHLHQAIDQWNLSGVPRPRNDTDVTSWRVQQREVEKMPDPGNQPAECEPLGEYE